jgi:hypothetical protein
VKAKFLAFVKAGVIYLFLGSTNQACFCSIADRGLFIGITLYIKCYSTFKKHENTSFINEGKPCFIKFGDVWFVPYVCKRKCSGCHVTGVIRFHVHCSGCIAFETYFIYSYTSTAWKCVNFTTYFIADLYLWNSCHVPEIWYLEVSFYGHILWGYTYLRCDRKVRLWISSYWLKVKFSKNISCPKGRIWGFIV